MQPREREEEGERAEDTFFPGVWTFKLRHQDGERDVGRPTDLWRESGITTTIIIIIVSYPVLFNLKRLQL